MKKIMRQRESKKLLWQGQKHKENEARLTRNANALQNATKKTEN